MDEVERVNEPAAAATLYREHAPAVVRTLRQGFGYHSRKTVGNGSSRQIYRVESAFEAEDICHEAIAIVLRQMQRGVFQAGRPVRPYLMRIATHLALRRGRRGARELAVEPGVLEARLESETFDGGVPPDPLVVAERDARVRAFVDTLDTGERAVLRLTFEDGQSQSVAAGQLGLSRDQVYRVMVRIRSAAQHFFGGGRP